MPMLSEHPLDNESPEQQALPTQSEMLISGQFGFPTDVKAMTVQGSFAPVSHIQ